MQCECTRVITSNKVGMFDVFQHLVMRSLVASSMCVRTVLNVGGIVSDSMLRTANCEVRVML